MFHVIRVVHIARIHRFFLNFDAFSKIKQFLFELTIASRPIFLAFTANKWAAEHQLGTAVMII